MRQKNNKAMLLKRRVRAIQARAKFAGILYLLGTLAMAGLAACMPMLTGTCLHNGNSFPVLTFFEPFKVLFKNLKTLSAEIVVNAFLALLFTLLLLTLVINILRSFGKLGWLFKRKASYANGFNRNMYAMDDLGDVFSSSFSGLIITHLFVYLFTGAGVGVGNFAYITLGIGFAIHFLAGLIGGTVTLFTTGERLEEQAREGSLFTYFVRNLLQIVATGAIILFLAKESVFFTEVQDILQKLLVEKAGLKAIDLKALIPAGVELFAWLFVIVLIKHSTGDTEFNRDGMSGSGMKNFRVFSFFTVLALGALIAFPYLGIGLVAGAKATLNKNLLIAAGVAFVGFLVDCIVKTRHYDYDDFDADDYFREAGEARYNNTII